MPLKNWDDLTAREQLDGLTKLLTQAGFDVKTRDRCFVSSDSAKQAIADIGEIKVPGEIKVQFLTQEEAKKMLIFIMPDFHAQGAGGAAAAPRRKAEDYLPCSYSTWAATKPASPGP